MSTITDTLTPKKSNNAKRSLRWAALFLGELRDGLTMVSPSLLPSTHYLCGNFVLQCGLIALMLLPPPAR